MAFNFTVVDNRTGKYPDVETIALTEEWAKHLIYCDIDCFAITEEGQLVLIDDCNNIAYPPADRFTVTIDPESLRPQGEWSECDWVEYDGHGECIHHPKAGLRCSNCCNVFKKELLWKDNYCPNCGAKMKEKE